MEEIKVDKNVPIPRRGLPPKYPLAKMEVGDSFFVPNAIKATTLRGYVYGWAREHGRKMTVRKVEGGFRCWRLK